MKRTFGAWRVVFLVVALLMPNPALAQDQERAGAVAEPGLADELIEMARADQQVQMAIFSSSDPDADPAQIDRERQEQNARIDATYRRNTKRLKKIVEQYGWPTVSMVGEKAAHGAFLIVQHADHDREFQRRALSLMEPFVDQGEAPQMDFVYLYDRVQVGLERPQRYGTQIEHVLIDGVVHVGAFPVEDRAGLDELRRRVGLEPYEEYRQSLMSLEGRPASTPDLPQEMTAAEVIRAREAFRQQFLPHKQE